MPIFQTRADTPLLVADIGGTNARFAIAKRAQENSAVTLSHFKGFSCSDFHHFNAVLNAYISNIKNIDRPKHACLAVAGPINGNSAHLTNLGWHLNTDELKAKFGLSDLYLVNDFAALARSTPTLDNCDLLSLRESNTKVNGPVSVMGPGTGFGLALLVPHPQGYSIVSSEGGHISFVPHGTLETKVWSALQENMGRVTVETLLSGVGLMRIYRELCHIHGISPLNYDPRTISNQALDRSDDICFETLSVFCSMLGSVAGDIALSHGSTGGVFLGGGILPKISAFILKSDFIERFLDKPPMQNFISNVPVSLITAPDAALKGAALLYSDHDQHRK